MTIGTQDTLNEFARVADLKRPATYTFSSVQDLLKDVDQWRGKEGVVVYSKNDQMLHKVKGAWYLKLHYLKSELSNIEKVLDVWLEQGMPEYQTFYNYIFTTFDYELAEQCRGMISRICDAKKEVDLIVSGMNDFVNNRLKTLPTRKLQAEQVISAYGITNRASFLFKLLDGKSLGKVSTPLMLRLWRLVALMFWGFLTWILRSKLEPDYQLARPWLSSKEG